MELKELTTKVLELFEVESVDDLGVALKATLEGPECDTKLQAFRELVDGDLSKDWLQMIFQYYQADRKEKKQDYTPRCLATFLAKLIGSADTVIDMCAGSGALTIQHFAMYHGNRYCLYELDKNVFPYLWFNMTVRDITACMAIGDVLENGTSESEGTVSLISNPPYNIRWKPPAFAQMERRFAGYTVPPESNANYAFILTALDAITDKAAILLPNGVLSGADGNEIRKQLIRANVIDAIITLPDSMFESTSIPTCIMVLNKRRETTHVEMIDMRETYAEEIRDQRGQFGGASHEGRTYHKTIKVLADEHMQKAITAISEHVNEKGFCASVPGAAILEQDGILTPSRYIEQEHTEEKHRPYEDIARDLNRVIKQKNAVKLTCNETLAKRLGLDTVYEGVKASETMTDGINKSLALVGQKVERENYMLLTKNKAEFTFANKDPDNLPEMMLLMLNFWKQHIMFLNNEENRLLAELRDAFLPDLMTGKIDVSEFKEAT